MSKFSEPDRFYREDYERSLDLRTPVAEAKELREQAVTSARDAISVRARARVLCEASAQTREAAQTTMDRSAALLAVASELQERITAYANALNRLGQPIEHAIEDARYIADEAVHRVAGVGGIHAVEREGLVRDLVIWTVDAYAA